MGLQLAVVLVAALGVVLSVYASWNIDEAYQNDFDE